MKHKQKLAKAIEKHGDKALMHTTLGDPVKAAKASAEAKRAKKVPITLPQTSAAANARDTQERKDLEIALRLIKLRWADISEWPDVMDESRSKETHGIFFTTGQLMMLNRLAEHWHKVDELLRKK